MNLHNKPATTGYASRARNYELKRKYQLVPSLVNMEEASKKPNPYLF